MYAVIDKDRASSLLASSIDADLFLISTGVERVAINFGKPNQIDLDQVTVAEVKQYLAEGHFAPGSMKPKIEACIRFLERSTKPGAAALITDPPNLGRALRGETGTRIVQRLTLPEFHHLELLRIADDAILLLLAPLAPASVSWRPRGR